MMQSATNKANALLTIGKVARLAQVSIDTIRYYERGGLLSPAQKSGAGYRLYKPMEHSPSSAPPQERRANTPILQ